MKKLFLISLVMTIGMSASTLNFNEKKRQQKISNIQNVYKHKLRKKCGYSAAYFAQSNTQMEWIALNKESQFKNEFEKICPRGKEVLSYKELMTLYLFSLEYASDSGNYPSS